MNISFPTHNHKHERNAENPHFMVAHKGSYAFCGLKGNTSLYNGVFFFDQTHMKMVKVLHHIGLSGSGDLLRIFKNKAQVQHSSSSEDYFFSNGAFCYHAHGEGSVQLLFDVRESYDMNTEGRIHTIHVQHKHVHIAHVSCKGNDFILASNRPFDRIDRWVEQQTLYDQRRGQRQSWWVYHGLSIQAHEDTKIVILPGKDEQRATNILLDTKSWEEFEMWNDEKFIAEVTAKSFEGLQITLPDSSPGILAGLPWFFQVWARDEAIAVGGLLAQKKYRLAGKILLRQISSVLPDGRIANRFPSSDLGSADGIGWCCLRLHQLLTESPESLSDEEWRQIFDYLTLSLTSITNNMHDGLVFNDARETWMDTTGRFPDDRKGARIEIQALTLRSFALHEHLAEYLHRENIFASSHEHFRTRVRSVFFNKKESILRDGYGDDIIRSNIFLAAYAYPDLLSQKEWQAVFSKAIWHLSTAAGGVSTIDVRHEWFTARHTGDNDDSYHRGDVWYWVNNIAAIVLRRFGGASVQLADKLYDMSVTDLLEMGACGHASEISSAEVQEPLGCWNQAWSDATLLEYLLRT